MRSHEIDYQIIGDDIQVVEVELDPQEIVRAEVGAMLYMEEGIQMQTSTGGGLFSGLKRMVTGDSFFITSFLNSGHHKQRVAFAAPYPGKIIPIDLARVGGNFICQKDAFLCAANGIDIEIAFTKRLGAGFFGGEGFFLATLSGPGRVYLQSLLFSRLADRIASAASFGHRREENSGLGGLLGGFISGD